ncbi:MAG: O-methyltransferase [Bryobacteraceae bacterium]|nr:O-methyltransferase [Bryobacteraceae bacterium]
MRNAAVVFVAVVAMMETDRRAAMAVLERLAPTQREMMNVNAAEGEYLADVVRKVGAKRALEIGTSNGYSGIWLAMALRETGGRLITFEIDRERWAQAQENFKQAGVSGRVDSRLADALEEAPKLEGEFDFVFIDAWKPDYVKYLRMVTPKVRPGGVIMAHNTRSQSDAMRAFRKALLEEPLLETQFVEPGPGGFSVSVKKRAVSAGVD